MYGHRVLNNFEKMSYFITKSWFQNEQQEPTEDELSLTFEEDSENRKSILEEIKDHSRKFSLNSNYNQENSPTTTKSSSIK